VEIDNGNSIPFKFAILNNYPNPFNPTTTISISVETQHVGNSAGSGATSLHIFNINGRLVDVVFQGKILPGTHEFQWDGTNYSSGVYFIKLSSEYFVKTRKMILLK
jgi:flagellar hook assembly protein FlgD